MAVNNAGTLNRNTYKYLFFMAGVLSGEVGQQQCLPLHLDADECLHKRIVPLLQWNGNLERLLLADQRQRCHDLPNLPVRLL